MLESNSLIHVSESIMVMMVMVMVIMMVMMMTRTTTMITNDARVYWVRVRGNRVTSKKT